MARQRGKMALLAVLLFHLAQGVQLETFDMRWDSLFRYGVLFGAAQALDCSPSSIQSVLPANASVNWAYPLQANSTLQVPKGDTGYPQNPVGLPALCAVSVQVKSLGNTTFGFGLFLPESWNGRFLAVGNGGFAGGINWADMVGSHLIA
jgi:feruloyl esterase